MQRIYFKLFCTGLFVLSGLVSGAQPTLQLGQFRPTGEMGKVLERKLGFGFAWVEPFEDVWRTSWSLSFYKFDTRMESFPVYGTVSSGGNTTVSLGEQRFNKYNLVALDAFADYAFVDEVNFAFFGGLGLLVGATSVSYESEYPGIKSESYSGGDRWMGLAGRLGVEWLFLDGFAARLSADRKYFAITENGYYSSNQVQLGLTYYFE